MPGHYRCGPSIIMNDDGSIDMWVTEQGTGGAWDNIGYRHFTDGGKSWSTAIAALKPYPGTRDGFSCADPGAIKIGNYYYIGYTSTQNGAGVDNHVYIARSDSVSGDFQKWNGSGWGGNPQPLITYTGDSIYYGYGEPSMVLMDSTLYIYYSDAEDTEFTKLMICYNAFADDWPLHLVDMGRMAAHQPGGEDSWDVKYVDQLNQFIAISAHDRFNAGATIAVWFSAGRYPQLDYWSVCWYSCLFWMS